MTSEGFQRKLDFAPTASIDKVALNNKVVMMRAIVRRAKLYVINDLTKKTKKLKQKKGTEEQKDKNSKKANRMIEEMKVIQTLKPDYVSKYALGSTEKFDELIAKPTTTMEVRALSRLSGQKFIQDSVTKFRSEHEDWKELAAYLMTKHTSREFKKKKTKEKMKKVEAKVKASETLIHTYLGGKLSAENAKGSDDGSHSDDDDDDDDESDDHGIDDKDGTHKVINRVKDKNDQDDVESDDDNDDSDDDDGSDAGKDDDDDNDDDSEDDVESNDNDEHNDNINSNSSVKAIHDKGHEEIKSTDLGDALRHLSKLKKTELKTSPTKNVESDSIPVSLKAKRPTKSGSLKESGEKNLPVDSKSRTIDLAKEEDTGRSEELNKIQKKRPGKSLKDRLRKIAGHAVEGDNDDDESDESDNETIKRYREVANDSEDDDDDLEDDDDNDFEDDDDDDVGDDDNDDEEEEENDGNSSGSAKDSIENKSSLNKKSKKNDRKKFKEIKKVVKFIPKEKIEGELVIKKFNLEKDINLEDNSCVPSILLSTDKKNSKGKKKVKDSFFDCDDNEDDDDQDGDDDDRRNTGYDETQSLEKIESDYRDKSRGNTHHALNAFSTTFVGSLNSEKMMDCRDHQFKTNKEWQRFRQEKNAEKSGTFGRGSRGFDNRRGRGFGDRGRGSSNTFRGRGRGRGYSGEDSGRGRGSGRGFRNQGSEDGGGFSRGSGRGGSSRGHERGSFRGRGDGEQRGRSSDKGAIQSAEKVHPSWAASMKRKQQQTGQLQAFAGKKIKFDD